MDVSRALIAIACVRAQCLLNSYRNVRRATHEPYRIVRAADHIALHDDFVKYKLEKERHEQWERDGPPGLLQACRDGQWEVVQDYCDRRRHVSSFEEDDAPEYRDLSTAEKRRRWRVDLVDGLSIACEYVRSDCVAVLLDEIRTPALAGGEEVTLSLIHI